MYDYILIRYSEIALKGKNQKDFLNRLWRNIKEQIKTDVGVLPRLEKDQGRILLYLDGEEPEKYYNALDHVFGISSYSPVLRTSLEMSDILDGALKEFAQVMAGRAEATFSVTIKRPNKRFPLSSMELATEVANHIYDHVPGLTVDLKHAQIDLKVEVRDECAYITTQKRPGLGGLPLGTGGRGMLLLSGGIDSPVAGWAMMRRGMTVEAIHFHSYPYTSEMAKEKVLTLAEQMAKYSGRLVVHLVPFTKIQEEIAHYCHDNLRITIMRRIMLRIAEKIAAERDAMAIITGDNLGQVASQTMESIYAINQVTNMPIFRPLVALDKEEIMQIAKKIDTYETSILPYEDCCTVFVPKDPKTKPKAEVCLEEEAKIENLAELIEQAVQNKETVVKYGKVIPERVQSANL